MGTATNQQEYNKENDNFFGEAYLQAANASELKKKSLFFFALTIMLTLTVAAGVLCESTNNRIHVLPSIFLTASLTLLLCTLIGGMLFFKRNIMIPLETTGEIVQRMAAGHLDKPIRIKAGNEIGQVAEGINGLAVNMQEVLLYIWNHTQQNFILLDRISEQLNSQPDSALPLSQLKKDIAQVRRENEGMKGIVTTFDYFEVKLEHEKIVSDPLHNPIKSKA